MGHSLWFCLWTKWKPDSTKSYRYKFPKCCGSH